MKIKKGDIVIVTNPYTNKKEKLKYIGLLDKETHPTLYANGFKRVLLNNKNQKVIVTELWAKQFNLHKEQ
jgi:hypothetical protein